MTGKTRYSTPWVTPHTLYLISNRNFEIRTETHPEKQDILSGTGGVTNISNPELEVFLYFARHRIERWG